MAKCCDTVSAALPCFILGREKHSATCRHTSHYGSAVTLFRFQLYFTLSPPLHPKVSSSPVPSSALPIGPLYGEGRGGGEGGRGDDRPNELVCRYCCPLPNAISLQQYSLHLLPQIGSWRKTRQIVAFIECHQMHWWVLSLMQFHPEQGRNERICGNGF